MKKIGIYLITALSIATFQGCNKPSTYQQNDFVNLLNIEVGYEESPQGYFFSDLGDWHGYGFNNPSDTSIIGGFRGPAFMGERSIGLQWLSACFEKLSLTEFTESDTLSIPFTTNPVNEYLPGMLYQQLKAGDLEVQLREIAVSDRSTMIEYLITNQGEKERTIGAVLSGKTSYKDAQCQFLSGNSLTVGVVGNTHHFAVSFPPNGQLTIKDTTAYEMRIAEQKIKPGRSYTFRTFTTYCPATSRDETIAIHQTLDTKKTAQKYFKENKIRWEGYLNSILERPTSYLTSERNQKWAVKALMTLHTNWRSAAGDLKHGGVQPGAGHFNAFWAWDSWEHAVALALFNPELAKEQMYTMFDFQTPEGMIIDLVSLYEKDNNTRCSKPPIAGWATYMVYQRTKDKAFIKEMLPKLLKYHEWRYRYRDHDQNGLCEYGGIRNEVYMGQWESGMDVAVKFDGVKMLKNAEGAYSFDQESIELNSYLCAEKFYLAYLLEELGDKEQAARMREEGKKLKKMIQTKFFDKETGYFYDRKLTGELVKVIDISGWIPLFTMVATPEQAAAVKKNMLDPELFGTYFPFSSLNHKHPLYQPDKGYFRGQTWMNYTYFGIRGWKNYGFKEDAEKYTRMLPDKLKGLADPGHPIRENWNSETGEGMSAIHFGWSSAFSILLLTEDADTFPYVPGI